jgi:hypothetical protein
LISRVRVTCRRLALAAAGALLVGVPLLAGPTANAQDAGSVSFNEVEPRSGSATSGRPVTVDQESRGHEPGAHQVSQGSGATPDHGQVGLLGLIATVCVVGVSTGAVRALISLRANRAE